MQANNYTSDWNCFWIYSLSKEKPERRESCETNKPSHCFQTIPFQTETSNQSHYYVGGYLFLHSSSGRSGEVR